MKHAKTLSALLTLSMLAATAVPALADEDVSQDEFLQLGTSDYGKVNDGYVDGGEIKNSSTADVVLKIIEGAKPTDTVVVATVPLKLPIVMDLQGNITTPDADKAKIVNGTTGTDIRVKEITTVSDDWSVVDYDSTEFGLVDTDTKQMAMAIRDDKLQTTGTNEGGKYTGKFALTFGNWTIAADNGELGMKMDAKLPKQTQTTEEGKKIATVSFTLEGIRETAVTRGNAALWSDGNLSGEVIIPAYFVSNGQNGTTAGQAYKVTAIPAGAFQNCTGLTSVTIPKTVTVIGANAFAGCTNLTEIKMEGADGSVSGAPWGATGVTPTYDVTIAAEDANVDLSGANVDPVYFYDDEPEEIVTEPEDVVEDPADESMDEPVDEPAEDPVTEPIENEPVTEPEDNEPAQDPVEETPEEEPEAQEPAQDADPTEGDEA